MTGSGGVSIAELGFGQKHASPGSGEVELLVGGWIDGLERLARPPVLSIRAFAPGGAEEGACTGVVAPGSGGSFHASLVLEAPELWWLAGLGSPALHTVEARLEDASGKVLDSVVRHVGLRTLECRANGDGSRVLVCNGVPVFARGAELAEIDAESAAFAVSAAGDAAFNALRLGRGSPIPPEELLSACDEAGIAILGAAGIGDDVSGASDAASFADDGDSDGDDSAAAAAMMLHPCLPDNPLAEPDDDTGFETARSVVSWAAPETLVEEVPDALSSLNGPEMASRTALRGGPPALAAAVLADWPLPTSRRGWAYVAQLAQARVWRRRIAAARIAFASGAHGAGRPGRDDFGPSTTGFFWGPMMSARAGADASSIDSAGRWKALHYEAARAFAPEAVFALTAAPGASPCAFRVSDGPGTSSATEFSWRLTSMDGVTLAAGASALRPGFAGAEKLPLPDFGPFLAGRGPGDLALWLSLRDSDGCVVSRDLALFAPPRALRLQNPDLALDVSALAEDQADLDGAQVFRVSVSASAPALGVFLATPGIPTVVEDSFFPLDPDESLEIHVATLAPVVESRFRAALSAQSLFDL